MRSINKHYLGFVNPVIPKAVPEVLEHPGKVVRQYFGIEDTHNVVCQPLESGAGVNEKFYV